VSAMQKVTIEMAAKYNMSIATSFYSSKDSHAVASGFTDAGLGIGVPSRIAVPDDIYVWGSTTKMFTGPAVLQLVEKGVVKLTDPITVHIDPILFKLNGTKLSQHFGEEIAKVQIQHLLHMTSGIQDYDGEDYARDQFANRSHDFSPIEIISKYVTPGLEYSPGSRQHYCSTNYILLGFVLANHASSDSWRSYDQMTVIPESLRDSFQRSVFVNEGTCEQHTPVHGFMQSYSTASLPPQDVWNVSCTGGWTGGNFLGSVADVSRYTYLLYNKRHPQIVSQASQELMTNFSSPDLGGSFKFYGMGTFSLDWSVGDAEAYGHVGDTYGYQSQSTYFPELDFVLTVATNVETNSQAQPAETTCLLFHEIAAIMDNIAAPKCNFTVPHRFIGTCSCIYS